MGREIERKFLVTTDAWKKDAVGHMYRQGYLCRDRARTVRVRIVEAQAFLTIKGPTQGVSRDEFEYSIPVDDAEQLFGLCEGPLVEKVRHRIPFGGFVWEVDEFLGENAGLVVAEIELPREDAVFPLPPWAGKEVTDDPRYANSRLSVQPFSMW